MSPKKSAASKRALSPISQSTKSSSSATVKPKPKSKGKSAAAYQKMKMTELRELLRERGLSDKGRKKLDLIERLTSDDINSVDFGSSSSSSSSSALANVCANITGVLLFSNCVSASQPCLFCSCVSFTSICALCVSVSRFVCRRW